MSSNASDVREACFNVLSLSGEKWKLSAVWLKSVNDVAWGPGMLVLLVGTGLYLTVGLEISHSAIF